MKNLMYAIPLVFLIACSGDPTPNDSNSRTELKYSNELSEANGPNELNFKGELIYLDKEDGPAEPFIVPRIEEVREDVVFRAKRVPLDMYLLNQGVPLTELEEAMTDLEGEELFYFEFEESRGSNLMKKYFKGRMDAGVSYLSFTIQNDFSMLTQDGKKLPCSYTTYERNFGVTPYERILIGFKGVQPDQELTLVYNDILFEKGSMQFNFASKEHIENNTKDPS